MSFPPSKKSEQLDGNGRVRNRRASAGPVRLNITSLIDMFTILLIFLLVNFSSGESITVASDIELPASTQADGEKHSSVPVIVSATAILVDGRIVVAMDDLALQTTPEIPELVLALEAQARKAARVADVVAEHGNERDLVAWAGRVTIQGDADLPFDVLERVIYSCGIASFDQVALAVSRVDEG